jgi:arylsulfatase A-like enzyme
MHRSSFLSLFLGLVLGGMLHAAPPNILMIAIDDQNDWIGCMGGHPQVKTPHLDGLAARGTLFMNAHCQAPLCNPSRASLMTGLRPSTTGIYGLSPGLRQVEITKHHVTLPQELMKAGYFTFTCGKIYHDGSLNRGGKGAKGKGKKAAQAQPSEDLPREFDEWGEAPGMPKPPQTIAKLNIEGRHPAMDWGVFPERDEDQADWKIADAAIAKLQTVSKDKPWFISCGFRLPHVPCFASQKWFDLYPMETLQMPVVRDDDRADLPRFADFLHWMLPEPRLKTLIELNEWKPLVRGYLASVSFMDSQVGRVLDSLSKTGQLDNTIVIVWGDHGWHLGEKGITGKNTLWNRSTRVPFIWAGPGITKGAKCTRPAELLDIFPTLVDLCNLPARPDLEGHSLAPQLKDASAPREYPAITTHNQGNHTIRTEKWRYIRYADGGEELYDEAADPNEWKNLANDPAHADAKAQLAKWLPRKDVPPARNSKSRVLTYDKATGKVIWEDKEVDTKAPLPPDVLVK